MKTIFYKDRNTLLLWTTTLFIGLIIILCFIPSKIFYYLFGFFLWTLCFIPSSLTMTDKQEKADIMYSTMPIKTNTPVLLRYIYLGFIASVATIVFQTAVCISNHQRGYTLFNINNMVTQSMLALTFVFASLWLMSSSIVKSRGINAVIIMLSTVTFGIVMSSFDIVLDCTKIDYVHHISSFEYSLLDLRFDILLRGDYHIIFWCLCLLTVLLCYWAACFAAKRRSI